MADIIENMISFIFQHRSATKKLKKKNLFPLLHCADYRTQTRRQTQYTKMLIYKLIQDDLV